MFMASAILRYSLSRDHLAASLGVDRKSLSSKGLVRVEHKYTERHVRVCLKAALDQHSVGIMVSSAYALAKEAGFPSMEKAVRRFFSSSFPR